MVTGAGNFDPKQRRNDKQRVTQYSLTGEVTELPDLINERERHACSKFENNDGVTVSCKEGLKIYLNIYFD